MKFIYVMSFFCCLTAQAWAQAATEAVGAPPEPSDRQSQREQRRVELRAALKAQRQAAMRNDEKKLFSEQERAALRQQLSQQQDLAKHQP